MWIARDSNGRLFIYLGGKPKKLKNTGWIAPKKYQTVEIDKELFPEVKWEDEEPRELILK